MLNNCAQCRQSFEITPDDESFLTLLEVPAPKQCPSCRLQRRLCERNTRNLYYRKCDLTGKQIISQYHAGHPFPVYGVDSWSSDQWDATAHGREIDWNRPFFEQYKELLAVVPHLALFNTPGTSENSDFNNCTAYLKNCYLICESDFAEDCYYSNLLKKCKDMVDCSVCYDNERCYECVDCINCHSLQYSQDCENCSSGYFLKNCQGCRDCIGCINQRQKQYMIWNKQYSKEDYEKHARAFRLDTHAGVEKMKQQCGAFFVRHPHKASHGEKNENCVGDYVNSSKNAQLCFDVKDVEDCRHCARLSLTCKSCMDFNSWGDHAELMYQAASCGDHTYQVRFCSNCINVQQADYCFECFNSSEIFGCIGIQKKKFCILNKQYDEKEYRELREKLVMHMKKTGEWGEYFPMDLCAFAYNEAFVMDQFPLMKKEVEERGWRWYEPEEKGKRYMGAKTVLPETAAEADDGICKEILECEETGKPYKIIPQELRFYRSMNIPLPRLCPDRRHALRVAKRNPYRIWDRQCTNCKREIQTTFAPERQEPVYCTDCYLKTVY